MIEKKTVLDKIEIERDGTMQIRFAMLLVEDGVEIDSKWLRTSIAPTNDPDIVLAQVRQFLVTQNKAAIETADEARLLALIPIVQTDEVVESFKAAQDAVLRAERA